MAIYGLIFPAFDHTSINYTLFISISLPLWIISFWFAIRLLWGDAKGQIRNLLLATLLTAVYWTMLPAPGQTWYWATGHVEYQLPFLLSVICLSVLGTYFAAPGSGLRNAILAIVVSGLAFIVTGLNELIALFLAALLGIGAVLAATHRLRGNAALIVLILAVTVIGLYISTSAPGNRIRLDTDFPNSGTLAGFLSAMTYGLGQSALHWVLDIKVWALAAILLLSTDISGSSPAWARSRPPKPMHFLPWWVICLVVTLAAAFAGRATVAYGQGSPLPGRVSNILLAWFLIGLIATLAAVGPRLVQWFARRPGRHQVYGAAAGLALVFALLAAPNSRYAISDLSETLAWRDTEERRYAQIRDNIAAGETNIVLAPIGFTPRLFFWRELSEDPDHWRNQCMAREFGADTIGVSRQGGTP